MLIFKLYTNMISILTITSIFAATIYDIFTKVYTACSLPAYFLYVHLL